MNFKTSLIFSNSTYYKKCNYSYYYGSHDQNIIDHNLNYSKYHITSFKDFFKLELRFKFLIFDVMMTSIQTDRGTKDWQSVRMTASPILL
ncbi:MAG: hypothetical protein YK1312THETA_2800003 [Marine Group I thaumarchaeote]|nr:MAG: hypothetical protein YK1312THETA_2800003 [Marine Group I thaumarchaeote]